MSSGYCQRVTANDGELGEQHLRDFQDNEKTIPTILTTSQKLSTGVDARNIRNIVLMRPINRSGPICLNSSPSFLSGFSADSHAASLSVGSITAYASSGVCLPRLECGLDWLYQLRYCVIDVLASVTES